MVLDKLGGADSRWKSFEFETRAEADAKAEELARAYPGTEVLVVEVHASVVAEVKPVVTWTERK
jgi:hypothetical protein